MKCKLYLCVGEDVQIIENIVIFGGKFHYLKIVDLFKAIYNISSIYLRVC